MEKIEFVGLGRMNKKEFIDLLSEDTDICLRCYKVFQPTTKSCRICDKCAKELEE